MDVMDVHVHIGLRLRWICETDVTEATYGEKVK